MEAPIPPPRLDDDEDVHWALSTAVALWGRGERVEALKWLRRAAEQASDVNADKRALELFKAAAEVANRVNGASAPPPPPPPPPPPAPIQAEAPRTPGPPPAPPPRAPSIPPRAGSVYPPPRPPSVPAPPHAGAPSPAIPRAPAAPSRSVPPPPVPAAQRQQPPARPAAPPVTPPSRPVAITTTKPAAPQALAPKRRRSFTGEPRPTEKARSADAGRVRQDPPHKPHRRRTHTDDDLNIPTRVQPQPAQQPVWDDLDEDTRVIGNKARSDELEQALTRLRTAPAPIPHEAEARKKPAPAPDPAEVPVMLEESTSEGPHGSGPASGTTAPGTSPPGGATERPPAAHEAALRASKRLDTLPALRVAVLATGVAGEVRLISLDAGDEPPPGAAVAVLVPMSAADGEAVARLFGAD